MEQNNNTNEDSILLQDGIVYNWGEDQNENSFWVSKNIKEKYNLDNTALLNSYSNSDINITIKNNQIKQSFLEKKMLIKNGEYEKSNTNLNKGIFGEELDDDITLTGFIDSIENNSTLTLNFVKDEGKELAEKYKNKLKNLNFKSEKELSSKNKLRVLSNKEYEEKIKLQNEKNFNNSRHLELLGDITQSMEFPLVFKYELFKSNVLGIQIALRAIIEWNPAIGTISYDVFYQKGDDKVKLEELSHSIEIENYSKVITSHKALINTIIAYLKEEILGKIDDNYIQLAMLFENYLNKFGTNLNSVLEPLSLLYIDYFKSSLNNFKSDIFKKSEK